MTRNRLTNADVQRFREMKRFLGHSMPTLAARWGVTPRQLYRVLAGGPSARLVRLVREYAGA